MGQLTIASLNTYGGSFNPTDLVSRYRAIADFFNASAVDVLHFQEVFSYYHLFLLKSRLPTFSHCAYQKSYLGPKGGLVTFSRQPFEQQRHVLYSRRFVPYLGKSIIELLTQRGALITRVKGFDGTLINTHLTAILNGDWSQSSKYYRELVSEVDQFHQLLHDQALENIVIASGDFNIAKGSDLFRRLTDYRFLADSFAKDFAPTRHQCFAGPGRKTNCVDYFFIFGRKGLYKIKENKRLFTDRVPLGNNRMGYASDHVGLQVSLELKA